MNLPASIGRAIDTARGMFGRMPLRWRLTLWVDLPGAADPTITFEGALGATDDGNGPAATFRGKDGG